ncbi:MAG: hypothetical protein U0599_02665 [Vicinamibacteria bacterium]
MVVAACVAATWADGERLRRERSAGADRNRRLAGSLRLTDLCLFGEAPTTRHLSQADPYGALQDHPGAFDHSRGGSLAAPPDLTNPADANLAEPTALPR